MPTQDEPLGRDNPGTNGWVLRVTHVASSGNTEARQPGDRRIGLQDRRLAARAVPTDRRRVERRDV